MIVGLSGYAGSGKDSVGDILVARYGFTKVAFADTLRDCMAALNPIVDVDWTDGVIRYSEAVADLGYTDAKSQFPEVRGLLQRLGTEVGRNILGENIWVEAAMRGLELRRDYVFTDMRFPNEYEAITDADGYVIRIERPGVSAVNAHPSETSLDDYQFDYEVNNDGTLVELSDRVDSLMRGILGPPYAA